MNYINSHTSRNTSQTGLHLEENSTESDSEVTIATSEDTHHADTRTG